MQCKNCGANLVRGFSFCLDCGMPVPPEALEESGLPQRNIDSGPQEPAETPSLAESKSEAAEPENTGDVKPQIQGRVEENSGADLKPQYLGGDAGIGGKALKPKLIGVGEESAGSALKAKPIGGTEQSTGGADVRAAMQSSSADAADSSVEKLVFCPNCGMRMQHNGSICDKCGMALGSKPNNAPAPSKGVPLFNNDADPFGGQFGGFGGELVGISDDDAARIDSFVNGGLDPMFNSGNSSFNVQATPDDFAQLTEQLANFSAAAGMPTIEATQNTLIRQKEPEKGEEREVMNFSMTDDLSSEPVPMSIDGIPVIGDYSMEEDPNADVNLDPYSFLYNSMDEYELKVQEQFGTAAVENPKSPEPTSSMPAISENRTVEPIKQPPNPQIPPETEKVSPAVGMPPAQDGEHPIPKTEPQTKQTVQSEQIVQNAESQKPVVTPNTTQPTPQSVVQAAAETAASAPATSVSPVPAPTKRCYACGRKMPINDKFCPNCGRSMYGEPNPNRMNAAPTPAPKKKPTALIVVIIIVVIAAAAVLFFVKKADAADIYANESLQTSFLELSDNSSLPN